ncbi:IS3 family transposase [Streptomyces sp. NPDC055144]
MLIKTECVRGRIFATHAEANLALFTYIDGFYNSRRVQQRLGYLSPIEFEEKYYAGQATTEPDELRSGLRRQLVESAEQGDVRPW